MHADRLEILARSVHRLTGSPLARHCLDERQQINRIEGVSDDDAAGMRTFRLEPARQEARRGGGDDDIGPGDRIDVLNQLDLELLAFGGGLVNELRLCRHFLEIDGEGELASPYLGGAEQSQHRWPGD